LLSAGAANADDVFQGSASSAVAQQVGTGTANVVTMPALTNIQNLTQITRLNNLQTLGTLAGNVSLITLSGHSAQNNGTAQSSTSNTFTLEGDVTPDCSFFVGNVNTTIDFGTIGIEARDNVGPASAFDMTAPATAQIQTNVAGCNTRNLVRVTKGNPDGMRNASTSGYDPAQFTNKLPYSVAVAFNGSAPNSAAAQAGAFNVDASEQTDSQLHGAWKSVFTMNVNVPPPAESLLAGTYTDTVNVSLTVQP
ncbi:MAG: hypothetical protein ACRED4_07790, partial [Brevundimonas sp.]